MILVLFSVVNKIVNDYIIRVLSFKSNYFRYKNIFKSNLHHKISGRTSLGVLVSLCAGQFNIGGEGQIYLGALGSSLIGLYIQGIPALIHIPLALLMGFIFGGFWGLIPGYLKAIKGVNEVITTLLLNYIAINLISYLGLAE